MKYVILVSDKTLAVCVFICSNAFKKKNKSLQVIDNINVFYAIIYMSLRAAASPVSLTQQHGTLK